MFFFMTAKNKIMSFPFQTDTDFLYFGNFF